MVSFLYSEWKKCGKIEYFHRKRGKITKFHELSYYYEIDIMRITAGGKLGLEMDTIDKTDNFNQKFSIAFGYFGDKTVDFSVFFWYNDEQ